MTWRLTLITALFLVASACRQHHQIYISCSKDALTSYEKDHAKCLSLVGENDIGVDMHADGSCDICSHGFTQTVPRSNDAKRP